MKQHNPHPKRDWRLVGGYTNPSKWRQDSIYFYQTRQTDNTDTASAQRGIPQPRDREPDKECERPVGTAAETSQSLFDPRTTALLIWMSAKLN